MLAAIDAYLIRRVGVAFQARWPLAEQHPTQGRARAVQACGTAQIDPAQGLRTGIALLVDQHATALHADLHLDEKVRSHGTTAQPQAQQPGHPALRHLSFLVCIR